MIMQNVVEVHEIDGETIAIRSYKNIKNDTVYAADLPGAWLRNNCTERSVCDVTIKGVYEKVCKAHSEFLGVDTINIHLYEARRLLHMVIQNPDIILLMEYDRLDNHASEIIQQAARIRDIGAKAEIVSGADGYKKSWTYKVRKAIGFSRP